MNLGVRESVVSYAGALRSQSFELDKDGIPTLCPQVVARQMHESALRWEAICRQAVELLSTYEYEVRGDDPREVLEEAEEYAFDIVRELRQLEGQKAAGETL